MSFIKKIRKIDPSLTMLVSLALICILFLFKTWSPSNDYQTDVHEIKLPKIAHKKTTISQYPGWLSVSAQKKDSLDILFNRAGLSQQISKTILSHNLYQKQLQSIVTNRIYFFKIENGELQALLFDVDNHHFLKVIRLNQQYITNLEQGNAIELIKSSNQQSKVIVSASSNHWVSITPRTGDTLRHIFTRAGLPVKTLYKIINGNAHRRELGQINTRLTIHFRIENHQLQELIFPIHPKKYLVIRPYGRTYQTLVKLGKPNIPQTKPIPVIKQTAPTLTPKEIIVSPVAQAQPIQEDWLSIRPVRGDTLSRIFNKAGLSQKDLQQVLYKNSYARQLSRINLNDEIRFKIKNHQLIEMVYSLDALRYLSIQKFGPIYKTKALNRPMVEKREYISTPVKGSLYQTAKIAGIPQRIIDQITQIFFWQVQLSREIRAGDRLNIAFQTYYINGKRVKIGDVLAVSYKHANGVKYEAIRHQARNGQVTYYRPNGTSLKKAFSRYPIRFSHISSNFGSSRKHPILHYRRPHKGIDLAAPIGTPIYSIGDGRISYIGRQNGYGNMIKINHAFSYTTVYAHMLRFQKGLKNGSYVQKGQIIGFVGQSGLATGPHCHYELHLNHIPRNPSSVALPMAQPIARQESYAFNRFTREVMAQLNLYEATKLASR